LQLSKLQKEMKLTALFLLRIGGNWNHRHCGQNEGKVYLGIYKLAAGKERASNTNFFAEGNGGYIIYIYIYPAQWKKLWGSFGAGKLIT